MNSPHRRDFLKQSAAVLALANEPSGGAQAGAAPQPEIGEGFAAFEGETDPRLLNPAGGVHGGWALTLIDSACACAAHSLLPASVGYASLETKANFTRPISADTGRVRCEAKVAGRGRQIITAEARLASAAGELLAHGASTIMVMAPR